MSEPEETETQKILRIVDKLAISTERGFADLRAELGAQINGVRSELGAEIKSVKNEVGQLRFDMNRRFDRVDERFDELVGRVIALERTSHTHPEA